MTRAEDGYQRVEKHRFLPAHEKFSRGLVTLSLISWQQVFYFQWNSQRRLKTNPENKIKADSTNFFWLFWLRPLPVGKLPLPLWKSDTVIEHEPILLVSKVH